MPPLFSVIIPTFMRQELLREAVNSVLDQTIDDLEVIVVDDAGGEPLPMFTDSRVKVVHRSHNGGGSASRNTGMAYASGRYVTFLDDDDVFLPTRLEVGLQGLDHPVSICWWRYLDEPGSASWSHRLEGNVHDEILNQPIPHVGTTTIARDLVPHFDERIRLKEDVDWWIRLTRNYEVTTVPKVGYLLRRHSQHRMTSKSSDLMIARLQLLDLHKDYFERHPAVAGRYWKLIGGTALKRGDVRLARSALLHSIRYKPEVSTAWHLVRAMAQKGSGSRVTNK